MRPGILPLITEGRILFLIVLTAVVPAKVQAQSCEILSKLVSPTVSITLAKTIDAGAFTPAGRTTTVHDLPAFCRVAANLKPTADSDMRAEIWLPISGWNGKFVAVRNGGWGGSISSTDYDEMADALRRGYATSATDDGHTARCASFVVGHPEKFIDFAYCSKREMTVEAKTLIKAYYGREARYSYWNGCSAGGRGGLLQAYRYPDEFNGVIAGDPANVRRNAWALWLAVQTFKDPDDYIPPAKYPMIHLAVLDACDANDGLRDGLIEEPEKCHLGFKTLECKGSDGPGCLTPRQVQTSQTVISPATDSKGDVLFPRLEPGTELEWGRLAGGPNPVDLFVDQFRYIVYQDPKWDWRTFEMDRDSAKANAIDKGVDEMDPHLAAFAKHGGKLLIYHSWAYQQVAPGSSIDFYKSVVKLSGDPPAGQNWIRLFMVPGMGHCWGGEGPDTFDKIGAIEQWVEQGKPPARIIAAHKTTGEVGRTRPLCPYPRVARYSGTGDINDASNFTFRLP
jgi:feruloyl esterase